jgi:hypothetical protein
MKKLGLGYTDLKEIKPDIIANNWLADKYLI